MELHVCGVYLVCFVFICFVFVFLLVFFSFFVCFLFCFDCLFYLDIVVVIVVLSLSRAVDICVQDYGYSIAALCFKLQIVNSTALFFLFISETKEAFFNKTTENLKAGVLCLSMKKEHIFYMT